MALKNTINEATPDKVETKRDRTTARRGYWSTTAPGVFEYVPLGYLIRTDVRTIKTWFACTKNACETFDAAYAGGGSIDIEEVSEVVHAYNLTLTETTATEQWVDVEPEA